VNVEINNVEVLDYIITNEESDESERYVFDYLKIKNKDIILSEADMIDWECKKPEIIVNIRDVIYSIEVKRIVSNERKIFRCNSKFVRKRNDGNLWHWSSTIKNGLGKVTDKLQERVIAYSGRKIEKHILFILIPSSLKKKEIENIKEKCIYIYERTDISFPKKNIKMFFMEAKDNLFTDLKG
jgi:hypothetical protein